MFISNVICRVERGIARLGQLVAWLCLVMVLLTAVVVILRYGFNLSVTVLQELVAWCHAMLFMLGAAWALQRDAHVRVDILYRRLSARGRQWVELFGNLFFLLPFCLLVGFSSLDYVAQSWTLREHSAETDGLPALYLLKALIPLLAVTLLLQGTVQVWRGLAVLSGRLPAAPEESEAVGGVPRTGP